MNRLRGRGFTLIEMVIVITLIAIITVIAVGSYRQLGLRARSVEAALNLGYIYAGEMSYMLDQETFRACAVFPRPDEALDRTKTPWTDASVDFRLIGFSPVGGVFFNYQVKAQVDIAEDFVVVAHADLDEDRKLASYLMRSGQKTVIRENGEY